MQLGERELELLRVMADGRLYALNALAELTRQSLEVAGRLLGRLAELGLAEALELRRADWRRQEVKTARAYRITPGGLAAIGAPGATQPPTAEQPGARAAPGGGATLEPARGGAAGDPAEVRARARELLLLRIMSDGALWGACALWFAFTRAVGGSRRVPYRYSVVSRCLERLVARGEVEALEMRSARGLRRVYRIAERGLEALARAPQGFERLAPFEWQRDPARLLEVMEGGGLWTLRALARATGWNKVTVRKHLRRLVERGLAEAVELRKFSWKRRTFMTAHAYRVKRGGSAAPPSGRKVEPKVGGVPSADVLLALSDGALWSLSALCAATRHDKKVVRCRLAQLAKLGFVEVVEVRIAPRRRPGLAAARLYRITEKGLEALERGQPPLPEAAQRAEPEPPEDGDPLQLAVWVVNWSVIATRALLHLRSRGEDSWNGVATAAGGGRYPVHSKRLAPILLRLRELGLLEWELLSPERSANLPGHPKRILRLTERGRQVAEAILKLAALLREESGETFL